MVGALFVDGSYGLPHHQYYRKRPEISGTCRDDDAGRSHARRIILAREGIPGGRGGRRADPT